MMGHIKDRWIAVMQPTPQDWERRWIPVEERLPVDIPHGYCLVTDGTNVGTAYYSKESNVFDHCIDHDYWKPTHWMPLPEPAKKETATCTHGNQ
jgi:hypothetical protein